MSAADTKNTILLLDFLQKGNRDSTYLADFLRESGFEVERPKDIRQFVKATDFAERLPAAILYLHPLAEPFFRDLISTFEIYGIPIFNSIASVNKTSDRLWLKSALKKSGLPTPDFFYGHPRFFKDNWERKVLKLRNGEDNLVMLVDHKIHSQDNLVFIEEWIHASKGYVDTVIVVGDDIFQVAKNDSFGLYPILDLKGEMKSEPGLFSLARETGRLTGLVFYSVDFIDGKIIDVNAFPNIFEERSFPGIADFLKRNVATS